MRSQFWTSRGLAVVAIVALHGLAATVVLFSRTAPPEAPRAEPMLVTLLNEQRPESSPAPKVPLQDVRLPTPVVPLVHIDVSEEPAVTITIAKDIEAPPPASDASAPIMATTVEYIRMPVVVYPPAAKRAHVTGTVHVRALVEIDGRVREASVHRSSGYELLDRAACESVRGALFKPYMLNGIARTALVTVPVGYFLKDVRTASR